MNKLFILLSAVMLTNCGGHDFSTDEGVEKFCASHYDMELEDVKEWMCINRDYTYKNIIEIGQFAYDAGCFADMVIVDNRYGTYDEMTDEVLDVMGWNEDGADNGAILINMIDVLGMNWGGTIDKADEDFSAPGTPDFTPPTVVQDGDNWSVTYWTREEAGMLPQNDYSQIKVTVDSDGNYVETDGLNSFSVEIGWDD